MDLKESLILDMAEYDKGMTKQIHHFIKVYEFAHLIGVMEHLDEKTLYTLDIASILHDIGIREALKKYGSSMGKYQEELGPLEAGPILNKYDIPEDIKDRVCYLIGHHHTYTNMDGLDYQILVEADFIVNLYEDNENTETVTHVRNTIFKTESGKKLLNMTFGL